MSNFSPASKTSTTSTWSYARMTSAPRALTKASFLELQTAVTCKFLALASCTAM
eukprot:CAMPEP_0205918030 /NCGR_PEP_ID=MMETSP1325-20131115/9544_1 /ASSEMBLY_ACC=CAM_ASM_000708 /TAXON_ID=236786 /ORGANISM="Florenciella sp., Strain RCC1007" /LENGTH=53 /DNA_ID=CAMNT_0053285519 /DNA_START=393 /DNA_END=554 /DNA_ORIENTATION=+